MRQRGKSQESRANTHPQLRYVATAGAVMTALFVTERMINYVQYFAISRPTPPPRENRTKARSVMACAGTTNSVVSGSFQSLRAAIAEGGMAIAASQTLRGRPNKGSRSSRHIAVANS